MKDFFWASLFILLSIGLLSMSFYAGVMDECEARGYDTAAVSSRGVYCIQSVEFETDNRIYQRGDL